MDSLEKYIVDHRQEFDDQEPSSAIWDRIDAQLPKKVSFWKKLSLKHQLMAAASVLLLLSSGFLMGNFSARRQYKTVAWAELQDMESFYQPRISQKTKAITVNTTDSLWREDIVQLENVLEELKLELSKHGNSKKEILEAIRKNYSIRLEILDRILEKTSEKTYINTKPTKNDSPE